MFIHLKHSGPEEWTLKQPQSCFESCVILKMPVLDLTRFHSLSFNTIIKNSLCVFVQAYSQWIIPFSFQELQSS